MSRRLRAAALLAPLALLVGACPGRGARIPETPVAGGTLRVAVRALRSFDPARAASRDAFLALSHVFDSLTVIDPKTGSVRPSAAGSWTTSKDGLTWRFRIARAVYHDGKRVVAADFKFAFDRLARKRTGSDAAYQLEQVRGFRASRIAGTARQLKGVVAKARDLLVITLDRPFAELPYVLAHPALAPLPARLYRESAKGLARTPVGNGPFKVVESTPGRSAVLERFDGYAGATPLVDGMALRVADGEEGWRLLQEGQVDVADVPASALEVARARFGEAGLTPVWATLSFALNLKHSKYRSPEVRRAISLAIDRQAIATTVYGNTKDAASGIIPRGVRGYVPEACGTSCTVDRERARQIVTAAFGSKPPSVAIDHLSDRSSRLVAKAIAGDLAEAGFRTRLRSFKPGAYLKLLQKKDHDFAQVGWIADVPTPDGFLAHQLRTGSPDNQSGFKDSRFDRAIDRARRTLDEEDRLRAYRDAEARALELMPLVPIVFFRNHTVSAPRVRGFALDGAALFDATTIWLARD